jgi:Protein of unknown function (DUF3551)
MRSIPFAVAMIGAASLLASADAMAQHRWCSQGAGADNCGFVSYEQCRANIAGIGGKCMPNTGVAPPPVARPEIDRPAPIHVGPVREKPRYTKQRSTKQHSTKQHSAMRPAAATRISVRSGARMVVALPDQALLTPPPQFDCAFKTGLDDASGRAQASPTRAQTDSGTDAALLIRLDYERQCYRHAAMILRNRLRELQAAVGKTISAADQSTRPVAIRPPDQALLTPPLEFDCEFKTTSLDGRAQPTETGATADAARRMKLDYERQCYQHVEMILRDRLQRLQAATGATIKAAKR